MIEVDTPGGVKAINKQDVKYILPPTSAQVYLGVGAVIEEKGGTLVEVYHTIDEIKDALRCLK